MSLIQQLLSSDVRKPTALVHFEREMLLVEQKLMTLIIFHCQLKNKDDKGFYYIKKSFIREFLGWEDSNNYPRIYEGFEHIFDNSIKWNFLETDRTFKSLKCKLIVSLLEPSETGQQIGFKLHPDLELLIQNPRLFAKIKLIMMSILAKPKYAFPLYEILSDFYSRGEHSVKMPLPLLRQSLGIPENSYESFVPFKKRVLKPNLDAINENTDCRVKYSTYRNGRKVGGINFQIEKQRWRPPLFMNHFNELREYYRETLLADEPAEEVALNADELAFIEDVARYNITAADARAALSTHGLEGALEIRDYVLSEVERRKGGDEPIRNTGAYMARCFRQGFGIKSEEERKKGDTERAARAAKQQEHSAQERARSEAEQLERDFRLHQTQLVDERLAQMAEEDRNSFDRQFLRQNRMWVERFQESGLENPMVRSMFYNFAIKKLLNDEERDVIAFATSNGVSPIAIYLIQKNLI